MVWFVVLALIAGFGAGLVVAGCWPSGDDVSSFEENNLPPDTPYWHDPRD